MENYETSTETKTNGSDIMAGELKAYSGYFLDTGILHSCASGGAATAIAEAVIRENGAVFGVVYAEDFKSARYYCAETEKELTKLKGSKYIAAEKKVLVGDRLVSVYELLGEKLSSGQKVLFIGLGCDVAAVHSYCKARAICVDNLYTLDLICHGPTFPEVQKQFLDRLEKRYHSRICDFSVRYKKTGWKPPYVRTVFENGKVYLCPFYETELGYAFKAYSKESCYHCKFKADNHLADITVGDYWGITKNMEAIIPMEYR